MNDLLKVITDMIAICRDADADDDEKRMAIYTISEAAEQCQREVDSHAHRACWANET